MSTVSCPRSGALGNAAVLPRDFYESDTLTVARQLIGCQLHRIIDGVHLSGIITETEAYCGPEDDACHSARGRTPRTEVMFGEPGHAYVYLIYGMWSCLNIVTEAVDQPEAVLIRAVEPVEGLDYMREARHGRPALADGPGKLCQAFGVTRAQNGLDLTGSEMFITAGTKRYQVETTPRIGIDYAVKCRDQLWRFVATHPR